MKKGKHGNDEEVQRRQNCGVGSEHWVASCDSISTIGGFFSSVMTLWKPQGREKKGPGREGNDRQDLDAAQRKDVSAQR
jgi:hypothetical protein